MELIKKILYLKKLIIRGLIIVFERGQNFLQCSKLYRLIFFWVTFFRLGDRDRIDKFIGEQLEIQKGNYSNKKFWFFILREEGLKYEKEKMYKKYFILCLVLYL